MNVDNFSMSIIMHAGNAKVYLHEALADARNGEFEGTDEKIKLASDELLAAHKIQTKFLQQDSNGELKNLQVLLMHAQDHLMTVISEKDLIKEMIEMYKRQIETEQKINQLSKVIKRIEMK
ncbi:PTS lactose/cellobiose transporter subunit IIA [Virgibacillus halodenitrificans]|uniref:PTS lactose/cellobiose transporter subunit IIA n=1 Tax=Virgibacillus halodenitrificans TaxID=1482 RepID=A0ABR7VNH7_VIRHA|nr:PTS lactose/cellobiose transporter subunit IIA [Virgibacillus halodenitrificans]MBD1222362.1 PTS lactose/cellobiose transporter subunit IIA [Virgibacillus halodenitrificans]